VRFEEKARELILAADHQPLVNYETLGRHVRLSVPTPDHYLPMLYVLALQRDGDEISFPVKGVDGRSVSMLSVKIG
jgi:4,5-DOPA dioxygenase extradiol